MSNIGIWQFCQTFADLFKTYGIKQSEIRMSHKSGRPDVNTIVSADFSFIHAHIYFIQEISA